MAIHCGAVTPRAPDGMMKESFCSAISPALHKERKISQCFIHVPAYYGKWFILSPLKVVKDTFFNPATGLFAWIGAE